MFFFLLILISAFTGEKGKTIDMADAGKDAFEKFLKSKGVGAKGAGAGIGLMAIGAAGVYALFNSVYTGKMDGRDGIKY
jgi:hypothetical protein